MELYQNILAQSFMEYFRLERLVDVEKIINDRCYRALCQIREILANDALDDRDCFCRIEKIVRVFEDLGSDAGSRHDFG